MSCRAWLFTFLVVLGCGCGSTPFDPSEDPREDSAYSPPDYRAAHEPWGSVAVRSVTDRRGSFELGKENYLNDSWYAESLFTHPVPLTLKRLIERELLAGGVMTIAEDDGSAKYLIDLVIVHFTAHADRDLIGLIPVIPSVAVEGRIDLKLRMTDQDGRPFLDVHYQDTEEATAATVSGIEATGSRVLLTALARVMARLVQDVDQAVPRFWKELGLPVQ